MKRLLALAATAFLATTVTAAASVTTTVTFSYNHVTCTATITLFSDPGIGVTKNVIAGYNENDACGKLIGVGYQENTKVSSSTTQNALEMSGGSTAAPAGSVLLITYQYPLVSGKRYSIATTSDGKSITFAVSGTYTVK